MNIDKSIHQTSNENDFNENICQILLLPSEIDDQDQIQIQKGYQIIITKTNRWKIYFRNQNDFQIQDHQIDKSNVLQELNFFNFNEKILLSKMDYHRFYKIIYEEVESKNGFTKYSIEQIELFGKLKEIVNEELILMKISLPANFFQYFINEIEQIYQSEIPDFWALKISSIFSNMNIIIKIKNRFNLTITDEIEKFDSTNLNVIETLRNLFEIGKENKLFIFFQCLSIFDYLLSKVNDNDELNYPIEEITKLISKKTDDLQNQMANELIIKVMKF